MASKNSAKTSPVNSEENVCVVCFREAEIYSIGTCDHPVCYVCSARMRVLCENKECPICRGAMELVVFVSVPKLFKNINYKVMKLEHRYRIYFEDDQVMAAYDNLMEHNCKECTQNNKYRNFKELKKHMKEVHELHYCDICLENLKIFTHERKAYDRSDLVHHKKRGDADDKSHRGHPQCTFCNTRFVDQDVLFRHLRREHYYCHFCDLDSEGSNEYYCDYIDLREHFIQSHFMCQEEDCREERFTCVFRTDIDLKAHWTQNHAQNASKQQIRNARTVDVAFASNRRTDTRLRYGGGSRRTDQDLADQERAAAAPPPTIPVGAPQASVDITCAEDFPSLGPAQPAAAPSKSSTAKASKHKQDKSIAQKVAHEQRFSVRMGGQLRPEDFPALGQPSSSSQGAVASVRPANNVSSAYSRKTANVKTVSQKPQEKKKPQKTIPNTPTEEDFPTLGGGEPGKKHQQQPVSWGKITKVKPKPEPKIPKVPKNPSNFTNNDFPSLKPTIETKNMMKQLSTKKVKSVPSKTPATKISKKAPETNPSLKKSAPQISRKVSETNSPKPKGPNKKKVLSLANVFDECDLNEPREDLSMRNEGDYQSLSNNRSSNISFVQIQSAPVSKAATELQKIDLRPGSGSLDFPSLCGNSTPTPDLNSNWVANSAVKSKAPKKKKENRKPAETPIQNSNKHFEYIAPDNFEARNKALMDTIKACCVGQDDKFIKFKHLAQYFRSGELQHRVYYNQCKTVLGEASFHAILPELLSLLPDITDQQGVYQAYREMDNGVGCGCDLHVCPTCGQVLVESDIPSHLQHH